MYASRYEYFVTMGTIPKEQPKEMMFLRPTTMTSAEPGFEGKASEPKCVETMSTTIKAHSKSDQPAIDVSIMFGLGKMSAQRGRLTNP